MDQQFDKMKEFEFTDKNALENNICSNCKRLLNVEPIFCIERNDEVEKICGRCVHVIGDEFKEKLWRQHAYENLAKCISYPCSNKKFGCEVILHWDEVKDHENVCSFQYIHCPLFYHDLFPKKTCSWMGNVKKLDEHIENFHKELVFNPPQFSCTDSKTNTIFFTHVGVQLVTIVIKFEKDSKYYCLLMINGSDIESQCFRYQLELFDENKNNSIILRKSRLESIGNMLENMNNLDKMLELDLPKLRDMLRSSMCISCRFGIVKKNRKDIVQITGNKNHELLTNVATSTKDKIPPLDEIMLQELECPVCNEHMIPPVYICEAGHSICSECKSKVANCPNCRCQFSGARNFTLEKLTTRVQYPCRNREIGCPFVTTSEKIRTHETTCELSDNPCILRCGWKGLRPSMYNHITDSHSKMLLQNNSVYIRDTRDKKEAYNILYVNGELFRFSIKGSGGNTYKFNVQHLGMSEGDPKFRYQLQIIDQSTLGLNLSLTNVCQCATENPNMAHATGMHIPWDLLKPFVFEGRYYYYKVIVTRILC